MKTTSLIIIAAITLMIVIGGLWVYAQYFGQEIPTNGNISDVADVFAISPATIDWGQMTQGGAPSTKTVQLTNTRTNSADIVRDITYTVTGWSNSTDLGLTLSWDYNHTDIFTGQTLQVTFTLSSDNTTPLGPFDFTIVLEPTFDTV